MEIQHDQVGGQAKGDSIEIIQGMGMELPCFHLLLVPLRRSIFAIMNRASHSTGMSDCCLFSYLLLLIIILCWAGESSSKCFCPCLSCSWRWSCSISVPIIFHWLNQNDHPCRYPKHRILTKSRTWVSFSVFGCQRTQMAWAKEPPLITRPTITSSGASTI